MHDRKPDICVDFDGVLHSYKSGWKGADVVTDGPVDGACAWLHEMTKHFTVNIFSSRSHQPGGIYAMRQALRRWLIEDLGEDGKIVYVRLEFPAYKPPALWSLDDRGVTFEGDFSAFDVDTIRQFRPWNKR